MAGRHAVNAVDAIKRNRVLIYALATTPDASWSSEQRVTETFLCEKEIKEWQREINAEALAIWNLSNSRFTDTNSIASV